MHQVVRATRAGLLKLGFPEILGNLYVYQKSSIVMMSCCSFVFVLLHKETQ